MVSIATREHLPTNINEINKYTGKTRINHYVNRHTQPSESVSVSESEWRSAYERAYFAKIILNPSMCARRTYLTLWQIVMAATEKNVYMFWIVCVQCTCSMLYYDENWPWLDSIMFACNVPLLYFIRAEHTLSKRILFILITDIVCIHTVQAAHRRAHTIYWRTNTCRRTNKQTQIQKCTCRFVGWNTKGF